MYLKGIVFMLIFLRKCYCKVFVLDNKNEFLFIMRCLSFMVDEDLFLLFEMEILWWCFFGEINIGMVFFGYVSLDCDVLVLCVFLFLVIIIV